MDVFGRELVTLWMSGTEANGTDASDEWSGPDS